MLLPPLLEDGVAPVPVALGDEVEDEDVLDDEEADDAPAASLAGTSDRGTALFASTYRPD